MIYLNDLVNSFIYSCISFSDEALK